MIKMIKIQKIPNLLLVANKNDELAYFILF
jgi:hypothetical protein